jgi:hypothetical protein
MFEILDLTEWLFFIIGVFIVAYTITKSPDEIEPSYIFIKASLLNIFRWGHNSDALKLTIDFFNGFRLFSIIVLGVAIIIVSIDFLSFLHESVILFMMAFCMFSVYVLFSYQWVLNENNVRSDSMIFLKLIILFMFAVFFYGAISNIDHMFNFANEFYSNKEITKKELFITILTSIIIALILIYKQTKVLLWVIFGWFPTLVLVIFFIKTVLTKIKSTKRN